MRLLEAGFKGAVFVNLVDGPSGRINHTNRRDSDETCVSASEHKAHILHDVEGCTTLEMMRWAACFSILVLSTSVSTAVENAKPDYEQIREKHWAYQPVRVTPAPQARDTSWPYNDIDRFILVKLEENAIQVAPDASREVLLRRVYFDLIGLPPTPEQIDTFVGDSSPKAFERVVDELLASKHFGERWGRHWLDVVRFGESLTLRGFVLPGSWRFRDDVIDAFNEDRPFNILMQEHVAGDLMPADSVAQKDRHVIGATFLALGNTNLEEQDKKMLRMDVVDEQLDTIGKAFLAQTIGCARCHDHKFDPIPTSDYYAMAGILRNTKTMEHANVSKWISVALPEEPAREAELKKHEDAIAAAQKQLNGLRAVVAKAKTKNADKLPRGGKARVIAISDLPGVVVDDSAAKKVGDWTHSTSVASYIGDGYLHDGNSGKGAKSLTFQPNFPKSGRYEVRLAYTPGKSRATNVPVMILSEDGERTINVNERTPPLIDGRFVSLGSYRFEKDSQAYVMVSNEGTDGHVVADAIVFLPASEGVSLAQDASPQEQEIQKLDAELKRLEAAGPKRRMVVSVVEEKEISDTQVHVRGSPHVLGPSTPRGFLSCVTVASVPEIPPNQSGRLQLGQWLARADNPLPARVMVNRVWHWLIGQGIVRTVDNFGTTGETPSHPELLDNLADRFVKDNWSVKHLVRQIVLSHAYQLASTRQTASKDPENRMHGRFDRRRLDAECLRDSMLFISGRLDLTMGGQTYPADRQFDYGFEQTGQRRSVYEPVFRNRLPEIFEVFDFADPSMVVGGRTVSTVAPQSLFMMNNPFPRDEARAAAERLLREDIPSDSARLRRACRLTIGREPTAGELQVLSMFLTENADSAAAWAQVFHALFASTDFRYVD